MNKVSKYKFLLLTIFLMLINSCSHKTIEPSKSLSQQTVKLVAYNPSWPAIYSEEIEGIGLAFGDNLVNINHFGSTSVPGLLAKPKIDILAVVHNFNKIDISKIEKLGFTYRGEVIKTGRYFTKESPKVHLHIFENDNPIILRNLKFRDCLRSDKKLRDEYASLKLELAKKHTGEMAYQKYMNDKTDFINNTVDNCKVDTIVKTIY